MAVTKLVDVIQPELFAQYVIDRTTEKSVIMNAGVIVNNPELNQLVTGGGTLLTMPSWNDLTGESQVLNDTDDITVDKITSKSELATLLIRAKAWGVHELAGALAGDDPMKAIGELVSDWWVPDEKKQIISILNGIFSSASMSELVYTTTSAISADSVLDAKQLMGDNADMLEMIYMHSAVFTKLQKSNVITFIPASESKISIPTYLGYRVVMDDSAPTTKTLTTAGVWTLKIGTAGSAGDTVTVNGTTYTLIADTGTVSGNQIKVGANGTASEQAINLKTALDSVTSLTEYYTLSVFSDTITFTGKSGKVGAPNITSATTGTMVTTATNTTPKVEVIDYTSYLLSTGCIQRGVGTPVSLTPVETDRNSLGSTDYLINRQAKVLHPRGISFVGSGSIVGPTPSNSELATGTNWNRVMDVKKIGIVKMTHRI